MFEEVKGGENDFCEEIKDILVILFELIDIFIGFVFFFVCESGSLVLELLGDDLKIGVVVDSFFIELWVRVCDMKDFFLKIFVVFFWFVLYVFGWGYCKYIFIELR